MKKLVYILLLTIFNMHTVHAQDIHFSQFLASHANLNPSLTGVFDADYRFNINHRNQWSSVSIPYKTYSGSADMKIVSPKVKSGFMGAGICVNNDKAGDSEFGTTQIDLSFSYIKRMDRDSANFISLGINTGFAQKSINFNRLTFDSQYNGDYFDPNASTNETLNRSSFGYFDLGIGMNWLCYLNKKITLDAGFSINHVNRPSQTFYENYDVKLHTKKTFHISSAIQMRKNVYLLPSVLYATQNTFSELVLGTSVKMTQLSKTLDHRAFYLGIHIRKLDALILSTGFDFNDFNIGFSYDINTSDLRPASNGKGAYEISLVYLLRRFKPIQAVRKICPPFL